MSFQDKLAATITPAASDKQRAEAGSTVEAMLPGEAWLGLIIDQHKKIEFLFAEAGPPPGALNHLANPHDSDG